MRKGAPGEAKKGIKLQFDYRLGLEFNICIQNWERGLFFGILESTKQFNRGSWHGSQR